MLRVILITAAVLVTLFISSWSQTPNQQDILTESERHWLSNRDTPVTIGITAIPPQVLVDETGTRYEGICVDMIRLLEQRLDYRFQLIHFQTWKELIDKAMAREVDVVFAAQMTPKRSRYLFFTEPYLSMKNWIWVRDDVQRTLRTDDLDGMRVAISDGSALHEHYRKEHASVEVIPVESEAIALLAVSFGEADAAVVEMARASHYIQEHEIANLRVAGTDDFGYELRFASRSDQPLLNQILDKGLAAISSSERQAVYNSWVSVATDSFDIKQFWGAVGIGLGVVLLILAAILLWVRTLRKRIEHRTQELRQEFTERARAEEALSDSERRYSQLVDAMNEGFVIVDADGKITYVNDRLAGMLGYRVAEMLRQDVKKFFDDINRSIVDEQTDLRKEGADDSYEAEWTRRNGTRLHTIISPRPLNDETGTFRGSYAVITDISQQKAAEKALRESEQRLALHVQHTPLGVIEWNLDFEVTEWNLAAERIFGFARKEVLGRNGIGLIFAEEDGPRISQVFSELLVHRGGQHSGSRSITRDGEIIRCNWHNTVLVDENEMVIGVASLVEDVTQRTNSQLEMKAERDKAQTYLDVAGVILVALDKEGKITLLNKKGCELLGYASEDIIGKNWFETTLPKDIVETVRKVHSRIINGELDPLEYFENDVITSSGETRTIAWYNTLLTDESGRPTGTLSSGEDVTERKRAEKLLRESEERFRDLFQQAPLGYQSLDESGNFIEVNEAWCRTLGYEHDEVIGRNFSEFLHPDYREHFETRFPQFRTIGAVVGVEFEMMRKDGSAIIVSFDGRIGHNPDGSFKQTHCILHDITQRKRVEMEREKLISQLEIKNQEMERFTYTVSHDLKSPLVTIGGFLNILKRDALAGNSQQVEEDIERISSAAGRMRELLDDLLQMSRIGRFVNPPEDVSLSVLASQATELVAGRFPKEGMDIKISPEMPVVNGDRSRLLEVMQNLIENSAKYMGKQGNPKVEIGCRCEGEETVCYVKDNGIGIDPQYHERVFNIFEQLEPTSEGTGIGLALVKRIVETHSGRIWVESDGIGMGTTFCFVLPENERSPVTEEG